MVVQLMFGHALAQMTIDRYADLFDGQLDEVADKTDEQVLDAGSDLEVTWAISARALKVSAMPDFVAAERLAPVPLWSFATWLTEWLRDMLDTSWGSFHHGAA